MFNVSVALAIVLIVVLTTLTQLGVLHSSSAVTSAAAWWLFMLCWLLVWIIVFVLGLCVSALVIQRVSSIDLGHLCTAWRVC